MAEKRKSIRPDEPRQPVSLGAADNGKLNSLVVGAQEAGDRRPRSDRIDAQTAFTLPPILQIA